MTGDPATGEPAAGEPAAADGAATGEPPASEDGARNVTTAAWLGIALGVSFAVCFATGVWSHIAQNPPTWYPARPAGLYRVTQGVHVVTGFATIPLLLAKLWAVHPHLFAWPPVRSALHGLERLALLPLVGGAAFQLLSGTANVARWYPWTFFFPKAHYWVAWITMGALAIHVGAKATATRRALVPDRRQPADVARPSDARERRGFLVGVGAAAGALVVTTAGGTVPALGSLSVLAQRRPGVGPQGVPVNKTAVAARVVDAARDPSFRLEIVGNVRRPGSLSLDELCDFPQRRATLPIACVEGWSASAEWAGVPLRDLVAWAGGPAGATATVESLQPSGLYRASDVTARQLADPDTLLALRLWDEPLDLDHGFPARLIGPNRPGVAQTKWVGRLVIR